MGKGSEREGWEMERLVEVCEPEVRIEFALNCKCRATVRLRSLSSTAPVAFKIQTSSPNKFLVNPPSGLIPPLSSVTFQVILRSQSHLPRTYPRSPSDRFLVKTAEFAPSSSGSTLPDSINSWFASRPYGFSTQDLKLKVAFVGPVLLRDAVSRGDLDVVRNLIKRQRSVLADLSPSEAESLLRVATELVNPDDMVHLLLEAGLRIQAPVGSDNLKDSNELHVAAGKGKIGCARALVEEEGADKNASCDNGGAAAVYRAPANGDRGMVEMGADPTIANDRGRSPLDIACDEGHKEGLEILEPGEAVLEAARHGDVRQLESLLRRGASLNYHDQYGLTALHAAAFKGHKEVVLMLSEAGLDLEIEDKEGHVPLHMAVEGGHIETVQVLVNKGANVNAESKRGATPLYMARVWGYNDICELLISRGALSSLAMILA